MDFTIIKLKNFGSDRFWLLTELNLKEYVESLTDENFNFEVQRKIVKNKYLDDLLTTIESEEPLPNITLSYSGDIKKIEEGEIFDFKNNQLEILDGLQRTYRLWAFWKIYNAIKDNNYPDLKNAILDIKKKYPDFFFHGIVDSKFFKNNFPNGKTKVDFEQKYNSFQLYFTIWTNLSETELVKKMLVLNAGHKAVSTQHQFEILFLNLWKSLNSKLKNVKILREKENDFNLVKKGDRVPGQYLFSSIITSLMSLVLSKPQRISGDLIYKFDLLNESETISSLQYAENIFKSDFILSLLSKLYEIDLKISNEIGNEGVSWFGKDTTLNGVFAGIGLYLNLSDNKIVENVEDEILKSFDVLKDIITKDLNIKSFNDQYNNLSGRSVNIGVLIRTVIMNFIYYKLKGESASWSSLFNQEIRK